MYGTVHCVACDFIVIGGLLVIERRTILEQIFRGCVSYCESFLKLFFGCGQLKSILDVRSKIVLAALRIGFVFEKLVLDFPDKVEVHLNLLLIAQILGDFGFGMGEFLVQLFGLPAQLLLVGHVQHVHV